MADEAHGTIIRGINWRETFPFTHIFRTFRIAIHPSKLILALAALLALYLGGLLIDVFWKNEHLPLPDGAMDAVACAFGIGHFPYPETAVAECLRTLAPGGRIAFSWWDRSDRQRIQGLIREAVAEVGAPPPAEVPQAHSTQPRTTMAATTSANRARIPAKPTRAALTSRSMVVRIGTSPG